MAKDYLTKTFPVLALVLATGFSLFAQEMTLRADHPDGAYRSGEEAFFTVESESVGELRYIIRHSLRTDPIVTDVIPHDGGTTVIPFRYDSAAFITVQVSLETARSAGGATGENAYAALGVSFGREQIEPFLDDPGDFDAFWGGQTAELDGIPLDLRVEPVEQREFSDVFTFSAAQIEGRRVYGYIVVPRGPGTAGPYPASLRLPPYGQGPNLARPDVQLAEGAGCLAVTINIHDVPVDEYAEEAYENTDLGDPEGYYYRYAVLAARRAIDVIAARADWNGRDLLVYGESQGGGLAFLTASIDDRVTHAMQAVAALSQHGGYLVDRPSGFPYFLEKAAATGVDLADAARAVSFYDASLAARRFAGPTQHYVNYLDDICPPATHYAAVNELSGPRIVLHSLRADHGNPAEYNDHRAEFVREYFAGSTASPNPRVTPRRGHFVDAGEDLSVGVGQPFALQPTFGYGGAPAPAGEWSTAWEVLSGPGQVDFARAADGTEATFSELGTYRLRLRVKDPYPEQEDKWWELIDDLTVEVTEATSSIEEATTEGFSISPNPAAQRAVVRLDDAQVASVELLDLAGRRVLAPQSGPGVDLAGVAPGTYIVVAHTPEGERRTGRLSKR